MEMGVRIDKGSMEVWMADMKNPLLHFFNYVLIINLFSIFILCLV